MTGQDKKLIRNRTAEFLIFSGQAGEQSVEARYESETVWLPSTPTGTAKPSSKSCHDLLRVSADLDALLTLLELQAGAVRGWAGHRDCL